MTYNVCGGTLNSTLLLLPQWTCTMHQDCRKLASLTKAKSSSSWKQNLLSIFVTVFTVHICQMLASDMLSVLPSAEKVVSIMISRSGALFRLSDNVLRDMEQQWAVAERATESTHPPRRVERRCAMKRSRAKVNTYKQITVCVQTWIDSVLVTEMHFIVKCHGSCGLVTAVA